MVPCVPIGIVTQNRAVYLDATLRSLSGTQLPTGTPLIVFDDASTDRQTKFYLYTTKSVVLTKRWPRDPMWRGLGLSILSDRRPSARGIRDLVNVVKLGEEPLGVVDASCAAVKHLFAAYPDAPGVILLQDDILFNPQWYSRLVLTAGAYASPDGKPLGILAGIRLNRLITPAMRHEPVIPSAATAQCLYFSRKLFTVLESGWLSEPHPRRKQFDDHLFTASAKAGFANALLNPFVCQHFGISSSVRPNINWTRGGQVRKGRVGYHAKPPYSLSNSVRRFV